ncbi:MAG TPA: hypothetical protein VG742_23555 [Dongiaceae bacterium]|nr:hypothetical protein [Dongiaceae bacterium]
MPDQHRQRCIAVLGPGRCGTSTIARGLISLDIAFGHRLKPAARKNPRGFFEDLDLLDINYRAHEALGLRRNGASVGWITQESWEQADLDPLVERAARLIRQRFGSAAIWGCKIGGMMRILPFWERVFAETGQDVAYVLAIRHPASVARSRAKLDPHRAIQEKSDLEFAAQILPFFAEMTRHPNIVVDYDRVMDDPDGEMRRIADYFELPITPSVETGLRAYAGEFVNAGFRHNQVDDQRGPVSLLTWRLYRALLTLAHDQVVSADAEIAEMRREFAAMAPALALIDRLEGRLRGKWPSLGSMFLAATSHLPTRTTLRDTVALAGALKRSQPRHETRA